MHDLDPPPCRIHRRRHPHRDHDRLISTRPAAPGSSPRLEGCRAPGSARAARPPRPELHGRRRHARCSTARYVEGRRRGLDLRRHAPRASATLRARPSRGLARTSSSRSRNAACAGSSFSRARATREPLRTIDLGELLPPARPRRPLQLERVRLRPRSASRSPSAAHAATTLPFFCLTSPSSRSSASSGSGEPESPPRTRGAPPPAGPRRRRTRPSGSTRRRRRAWPRTGRPGCTSSTSRPSGPAAVEQDAGAALGHQPTHRQAPARGGAAAAPCPTACAGSRRRSRTARSRLCGRAALGGPARSARRSSSRRRPLHHDRDRDLAAALVGPADRRRRRRRPGGSSSSASSSAGATW